MKRASRVSSRTSSRRRHARRRAPGYVLTFAPDSQFDSAVLYTGDQGQVRAYPDAMPGAGGSHASSWGAPASESREVCALVTV